ncbi:hypothetical protein EDC19_2322 [Natranaerovirga hydrolytica]|uniref:Uncharacterized protein n=1 Tax=Natranaerovirga hydrolytica TaxID=680378 RepID=A0A4R1ML60_9FIRM|nr:hypothetical protein [Natranaerovirga hydrolytica]TCK90553.1 hypothetical protein EDC19_2322 [Natranaerovirga hydrolytica]
MRIKKSIQYIIVISILLILIGIIHAIVTAPIWVGKTDDGNWTIVYEKVSNDLGSIWEGTLYWNGEEDVSLNYYQFYVNGSLRAGERNPSMENQVEISDEYSFIYGHRTYDSSDHITLNLRWRPLGETTDTTEEVVLKRRYRYIPFYRYH